MYSPISGSEISRLRVFVWWYPDIKEFISEDLIIKLSKELSVYDYSGIFLFSGFVEPMLDKNIFKLVNIVRNNLPKAKIEMVTNGDVLDIERTQKLFNSGLSTLLISIYDGKKEADEMEKLISSYLTFVKNM